MNPIDYWKACDEYSVVQAALLMVGSDPEQTQYEVEGSKPKSPPPGYIAIRTALCNAIAAKSLKTIVCSYLEDQYNNYGTLDLHGTLISVSELDRFVKSKNMDCEYFKRYIDPIKAGNSPQSLFYAPKLLAAIQAWSAVTADPKLLAGKSPKAALMKWLTAHAAEFDLIKEDGTPNKQGIEEICKIANWRPQGGASQTQSSPPASTSHFMRLPSEAAPPSRATPKENFDLDDEIPF